MRGEVRRGGVFYDIGANIGFYSLIASSIVGPTGRVLAFEPGNFNLPFLRENAAQVGNVEVCDFAIGKSDGSMTFDRRGGAMSGRLLSDTVQAVDPTAVKVRSIDSLVSAGFPQPDVLKIDIEGGEIDALEGAVATLRRRPVILLELHQGEKANGIRAPQGRRAA